MWRHDYSWSDIALSFGATLLLAVLAVTSLGLRYVTDPIACWLPAQFEFFHRDYTHELCFQRTNFYLPFESVSHPAPHALYTVSTYHQWVPFALGIGALLCLMPHVIWRMLSGLLWMDAHALLSTLADNQRQAADRRHVVLRDTAILLQAGFKGGNVFLALGAMFRKLLTWCHMRRLSLVQKERTTLRPAKNLNGSIPLPHRSVICDFEIRQHENVHRYAVQCLLPLSPVYSKAFTFLFYFFLLLTVLSVLDLLIWVGRVIIPGLRDAAVQRYLNAVSGGDGDGAVSQLYPRVSRSTWVWDEAAAAGADRRLLRTSGGRRPDEPPVGHLQGGAPYCTLCKYLPHKASQNPPDLHRVSAMQGPFQICQHTGRQRQNVCNDHGTGPFHQFNCCS
ncbi:hypothetical protein BaRGS_00032214 [Batillaria attramentaria]|uniref:Innexin n=1 Tax=Batillaria attramentaria TaxID=370345 RepID=A0ABD0JNW5_9CAEN